MKLRWMLLPVAIALLPTTPVQANPSHSVGRVECQSTNGPDRTDNLYFAALTPEAQGFNLLIVENAGQHILTLNERLVVQKASTIQGQSLTSWNLTAYDGTPVQLSPNGGFRLAMMVSTRSSCTFQGPITFLQGAEGLLRR
jgi:hypothetical protein